MLEKLISFIKEDKTEEALKLIEEENFDISKPYEKHKIGDDDYTALHLAAAKDNKVVVEVLIKKGANLDTQNRYGKSALSTAIKNNKEEIALILIKEKANVNSSDDSNHSIMHVAAEYGNVNIIKALIKAGADPSDSSIDGHSPIDSASKNIPNIIALIEAEVDYEPHHITYIEEGLRKILADSTRENKEKFLSELSKNDLTNEHVKKVLENFKEKIKDIVITYYSNCTQDTKNASYLIKKLDLNFDLINFLKNTYPEDKIIKEIHTTLNDKYNLYISKLVTGLNKTKTTDETSVTAKVTADASKDVASEIIPYLTDQDLKQTFTSLTDLILKKKTKIDLDNEVEAINNCVKALEIEVSSLGEDSHLES